ncbi:hypothetical protein [Kitasatospora sp. NBC_00315]|uniref:hypothetical protein n=1 Tax=Kitasatospora sp. NBC_00315 TaxID=2975963 RepID=UPI00324E0DBD
MRSSAFLYPWDVVGDRDAPARLAGLGVQQITLAGAYHSTRALTPRHPRTRIVTARHAAVYYPPDPGRWRGRALQPYTQSWVPGADPFDAARSALAAAGLEVHSWVVLAHNSRLGEENERITVENAYGEHYPWAPCVAQAEVVEYCADLAAEAAVRPGVGGVELEACGWYGLAHLHAHDKIAGVPLGPVGQYLMSLCFCAACGRGYRAAGADPGALRAAVRTALEPLWRGGPEPRDGDEPARAAELLGADLAGAALAHRVAAAFALQRAVVESVRAASAPGFRILLHADPGVHRSGSNPGVDVPRLSGLVDGLVVPAARVAEAAAVAPAGAVLAANLGIVEGAGGDPTATQAPPGSSELRLYHAGLASDEDLRQLTAALGAATLGGRP